MFERILCPLDGSPAADTALAYVGLIPSRRVRLLRVEPDERGPMLASAPELAAWRGQQEEAARAALWRAGEPLARQGREVEAVFAFGDPAERIVASAADADLVVMSSRGLGAGRRVLLGGVADRVVRAAPVATLVVRGGERPAAGPPIARVVVPLDGSTAAERALPVAERLAGDLGVPIRLVRVVDRGRPELAERAGRDLDEQARRLRDRDLAATARLLTGDPVPALLEEIGPGEVVVMTTRGHGGLRRLVLGSVADQIVRRAEAPVLLVRGTEARRAVGRPGAEGSG